MSGDLRFRLSRPFFKPTADNASVHSMEGRYPMGDMDDPRRARRGVRSRLARPRRHRHRLGLRRRRHRRHGPRADPGGLRVGPPLGEQAEGRGQRRPGLPLRPLHGAGLHGRHVRPGRAPLPHGRGLGAMASPPTSRMPSPTPATSGGAGPPLATRSRPSRGTPSGASRPSSPCPTRSWPTSSPPRAGGPRTRRRRQRTAPPATRSRSRPPTTTASSS